MKKYSIAICDSDAAYAVRFMGYINSRNDRMVKASAFTSMRGIEDYLKDNRLDLILSGCSDYCDDKESVYGIRFIGLTEDYDEYLLKKDKYIFKYADMEEIFRTIKYFISSERILKNKKILCVFSPIGRCGKTELAKALAACDEAAGGLYIGVEDYSGGEGGTFNALYHIKERLADITEGIAEIVSHDDNLSCLDSIGRYPDMRELDREDVKWFIDKLLQSGRFSKIVFDIGGGTLSDYSILGLFDRIYIPVLRDAKSVKKLEGFYRLLEEQGLMALKGKITELCVPDAPYDSPEMIKTVTEVTNEE